ncbi:MAG: porin [Desulfuromonas sp.]|nr:porin [Desulfuromonas sp.]
MSQVKRTRMNLPIDSCLGVGRWLSGKAKAVATLALMFALVCMLSVLPGPTVAQAADIATINEINALKERLSQLEAKIEADAARAAAATTVTIDAADVEGESTLREMVTEVVNSSKPDIRIGGALRVNYGYQDWSEASKDKGGDFAFDTFRLNLDGTIKDIIFSAEYRFYPEYDFHTIHHGYMGYNFTDDLQVQLGIHQVPFGLQPFASHNFWFSGLYYIGLEDDYDMGVKLLYNPGQWRISGAFYKNDELGKPGNSDRYSVDVISNADGGYAGAQAAGNEETNQGNLRIAYQFDHSERSNTEIGVSGEYGQLYNNITGKDGDHWASAVHLNGNYGPFNLQLEYLHYEYAPKNPATINGQQVDKDLITMGGYGSSWGVPLKGDAAVFNLAYTVPVSWGPITALTFYSDNTVIVPNKSRFDDIWQNVVGTMISAGPVYTYIDVISGENMIFSGGDMSAPDNERTTRVNVNFGYYF